MNNAIELNNEERTPCEIWCRVMGYHRPKSAFNAGKQSEYAERKFFKESVAMCAADFIENKARQAA